MHLSESSKIASILLFSPSLFDIFLLSFGTISYYSPRLVGALGNSIHEF